MNSSCHGYNYCSKTISSAKHIEKALTFISLISWKVNEISANSSYTINKISYQAKKLFYNPLIHYLIFPSKNHIQHLISKHQWKKSFYIHWCLETSISGSGLISTNHVSDLIGINTAQNSIGLLMICFFRHVKSIEQYFYKDHVSWKRNICMELCNCMQFAWQLRSYIPGMPGGWLESCPTTQGF